MKRLNTSAAYQLSIARKNANETHGVDTKLFAESNQELKSNASKKAASNEAIRFTNVGQFNQNNLFVNHVFLFLINCTLETLT